MPGRPRAGGQYQECYLTLCPIKSSHPLRGATSRLPVQRSLPLYFYPRTPCGVRPSGRSCIWNSGNFYPRTPCGVRPQI